VRPRGLLAGGAVALIGLLAHPDLPPEEGPGWLEDARARFAVIRTLCQKRLRTPVIRSHSFRCRPVLWFGSLPSSSPS